MNQTWVGVLIISAVVLVGFLVYLILELRKTARSINEFLKTTEGSLKPVLDELQQTLKSLRNVSDNLGDATKDIKVFSGAVKDVGENVSYISHLIGEVTSSTAVKASGLKAGIKAAIMVLLDNIISRKGVKK